jgi:hypothetical protein
MPEVLDPGRLIAPESNAGSRDDERALADSARSALEASCAYGRQLWEQLQATREYLLASLPPDPRREPTAARRGAKPEGPADESGWVAWMAAYADVTSALAGPAGDSGHGEGEARRVAQERRS